MGLSLKQNDMHSFLSNALVPPEQYSCMLWGVMIIAGFASLDEENEDSLLTVTWVTRASVESLNNAFCYVGCTEKTMHIIVLNNFNTSQVLVKFKISFNGIKKVKVRKALFTNTRTVEIDCEDEEQCPAFFSIQVKTVPIGTDIKGQQENSDRFFSMLSRWNA